ncbi:MAG: ABC transporter substrate-binding protein, partial [Candidatus Dormibacteraceae bacterium]
AKATAPAGATAAAAPTAAPAANSAATTEKVEIELGSYFNGGPRLDFMNKVIAKFRADNPNVTVKFQPVPSAQYWDKMQVRLASGTAPDTMIGSGATFLNFAEKGGWHEVDTYIKADKVNLDGYYQQPKIFNWQGKQYGLPFMENVTLFLYNKTLFKNAGVDEPTDQWTWDDMLSAAKKLTKPGQYGLIIHDGFEFNWWTFIWSHGGDSLSSDLKKTTLEMPETMEAFQWLVDLKQKYKVSPSEGDTTLGTADDFMTGKVAMESQGSGSVGNWIEGIKDFEWDFFYVPADPKTNKRVCSSNGNPYLMTTDTKHPDQSWLLLKHLASPFTQNLIGELKIAVPTLISVATDPNGYLKPPPAHISYVNEDLKIGHDDEFHKLWLDWYNEITKDMLLAFSGEKTVVEAAKTADEAGDRILARE